MLAMLAIIRHLKGVFADPVLLMAHYSWLAGLVNTLVCPLCSDHFPT